MPGSVIRGRLHKFCSQRQQVDKEIVKQKIINSVSGDGAVRSPTVFDDHSVVRSPLSKMKNFSSDNKNKILSGRICLLGQVLDSWTTTGQVLDRSGHVQIPTFHKISFVSGLKIDF